MGIATSLYFNRLGFWIVRKCYYASLLFVVFSLPVEGVSPPVQIVRSALIDRFDLGKTPSSLQEDLLSETEIRGILSERLDSVLLQRLKKASGKDFRMGAPGGPAVGSVVVLILSYPDAGTADDMARLLEGEGGYLRRTKILAPFSAVSVGHQLIIAFTENAGDAAIAVFVRSLPRLFEPR